MRMLSLFAIVAVVVAASPRQQNNRAPKGFTAIFNGKDLSGWHGMKTFDIRKFKTMSEEERKKHREQGLASIREHWRVENGELVNDGHGQYLTTDKDYGDIELFVDYKTVPLADSGIYLRGTPQVQIWDTTEEKKFRLGANKGSGGLWNNSKGAPGKDPLVPADARFGEWNRFRIVQVGARTSIWLNGWKVVDHAILENTFDRKSPLYRRGPIQLQTHGGEIRWRNILLREIPSGEADRILDRHGDDGFVRIFNGKDLTGWTGAVEQYEVRDGAVVCKPGKGGNLVTKEEYADFVVRLEFKLPPGGNNGLIIRYPGKGDAAYNSMCELQVLDNTAAKYSKLNARQYHGSAYAMVPAKRGYLRPVGEWNFQEVTVKGSTIKVELNGSVILNTDLAKVTELMKGRTHPGKDRTKGSFGFAGHRDPVMFRNIRIKRLD